MNNHPITPPPPHLLKKFSAQAQDEAKNRNGAGYLKTFATLCIEWAMNSNTTSNDRQIRSSEITPPPEFLSRWEEDWHHAKVKHTELEDHIATQAARWGADQELKACYEWVVRDWTDIQSADMLLAARRPKPPSLKEQAIAVVENSAICDHLSPEHEVVLRRALEALDD